MISSNEKILSEAGILDQPEYDLFRKWHSEAKMPLVIFFGSGLSVPAGLPDWDGLKSQLAQTAHKKIDGLNKIGDDLYGYHSKYQAAKSTKDYWIAIKLYKEILGEATYVQRVREILTPRYDAKTPTGYNEILKLQPRGLITLNLDNFAGNALVTNSPGNMPVPVYGKEIARKWEVIQYSNPFLVQLHGSIAESGSWILTHDDLRELLDSPAHKAFIHYIFLHFRILFYGISADDTAISGRLLELRNAGFKPQGLFWLTNKIDSGLNKWTNDNWVRVINYKAVPSHEVVLKAFVDDCNGYGVRVDNPPVVISSTSTQSVFKQITPKELATRNPEEIRTYLSSYLNDELVNLPPNQHYDVFDRIIKNYGRSIHNSFYVSDGDDENVWFGHRLMFPSLGEGTFGNVYQAETPDGGTVAIKIMRESIHNKRDMLGGFRRGVRSMKIVSSASIVGMVKIIDAFELPPTIVMEKVDGIDLDKVIADGHKLPWLTKLKILYEASLIIRAAHLIPETVIHRDVKPTNIMLKDFDYTAEYDPKIVVLDFDMSWHKGAEEKDVIFEARDDFAYLAPEQVISSLSIYSRSTLVDSYGLGMTAYYIFAEKHPQINAYLGVDWRNILRSATSKGYIHKWISAPNRLSRLIFRCTQENQKLRMDFGEIILELQSIMDAISDYKNVKNIEIFAEEILAHVAGADLYKWDYLKKSGVMHTQRGVQISCSADLKNDEIQVVVDWQDQGVVNRGSIARYVDEAIRRTKDIISSSNWMMRKQERGMKEISIVFSIDSDSLRSDFAQSAKVVQRVYKEFNFA